MFKIKKLRIIKIIHVERGNHIIISVDPEKPLTKLLSTIFNAFNKIKIHGHLLYMIKMHMLNSTVPILRDQEI